MSSSSVWQRLHGIFNKSRPHTPISLSFIPTDTVFTPSPPSTNRKRCLREIFDERDNNLLAEKFRQLSQMSWFRRQSNVYLYTVRRLSSAKEFNLIQQVIEEQKKFKEITIEGFVVRLISLYGEARMPDQAQKLFDEMPELNCVRSVMSFNALLGVFLHSQRYDHVLDIFPTLPSALSIRPDVVSYNTLISTYCKMGSLEDAMGVLDVMEEREIYPDRFTFNVLLEEFYGSGKFSAGEELWALMESKGIDPCVRSYNARMSGLVLEKRLSEAVEVFESLRGEGIEVDVSSYNVLLKGFCDECNVDEAKGWYSTLYRSNCVPNKTTYMTLVPFMHENGDSGFADELCVEAASVGCHFGSMEKQIVVDEVVESSKHCGVLSHLTAE